MALHVITDVCIALISEASFIHPTIVTAKGSPSLPDLINIQCNNPENCNIQKQLTSLSLPSF